MKDTIFKALELKREPVDVCGVPAFIQELDVAGRDAVLQYASKHKDGPYKTFAFLIVHSLLDANGQPLFTVEDMPALLKLSGQWLDKLGKQAMAISGLDADAVTDAKKN